MRPVALKARALGDLENWGRRRMRRPRKIIIEAHNDDEVRSELPRIPVCTANRRWVSKAGGGKQKAGGNETRTRSGGFKKLRRACPLPGGKGGELVQPGPADPQKLTFE